MIQRYTPKEAGRHWKEAVKFRFWLKVEIAILWARMKLGQISSDCYEAINRHARFTLKRINELEKRFDHDMIAFVECVRETLRTKGVPSEWADEFHKTLTSYDTEDPAQMLMLIKMGKIIIKALDDLETALLKRALEYQWAFMMARTHGQAAEPTTFGKELLVFVAEIRRAKERIKWAMKHDLACGKMSGAVGTYAGIDPNVEAMACQRLGLKPAMVSTQILQRDRHANFISTLVIATSVIEQMAKTFWVMMRFEVKELEEPRRKEQRGSSAMPHKKNPIAIERLYGLARVMRGYLQVAMENIGTFEDRDISQSGPERIILPDATSLALYMIRVMTRITANMKVFPEQMLENIDRTYGTWAGQRVRYALAGAGIPDFTIYELVQQASFAAVNSRKPLAEVLGPMKVSDSDPRTVNEVLPQLTQLFDPKSYVQNGIETIFSRFFPEKTN